ncbi:MAG: GNAT family N-acetyltransferase [Chloroflexi bacterium]|nr:GNAT family N-acetyltransferase [Chloroflexota bacterium]
MTDQHNVALVPLAASNMDGYDHCVDVVALERRYIGIVHAPSLYETLKYVEGVRSAGGHILLEVEGDKVVGWCDTKRETGDGFTYLARIGMGLLPEYLAMGIGRRMLDDALSWAWDSGAERVELSVFTDNEAAIRLYRAVGFVEEGIRRKGRKLDGHYTDITEMAVFRPGF